MIPLLRRRPGFTLIETMMFLGILGMMGVVLTSVFVSTQEARARQQGIALVEQRGGQLMFILTRRIRRAETVLWPASGYTGSILALQMAQSTEFPTIVARTSSGNLLIIEEETRSLAFTGNLVVNNLLFRNVGGTNVILSFDLQTTFISPKRNTYTRHFESTVTIFPDDLSDSGGCGTCSAPTCTNHVFKWNICDTDNQCQQSADSLTC